MLTAFKMKWVWIATGLFFVADLLRSLFMENHRLATHIEQYEFNVSQRSTTLYRAPQEKPE